MDKVVGSAAEAVAARMDSGRLHPTSPFGLTYAIVSSLARREAAMVAEIAREVGTSPSMVFLAMSLIAAVLARDRPAPRNFSSGVANRSSGVGNFLFG